MLSEKQTHDPNKIPFSGLSFFYLEIKNNIDIHGGLLEMTYDARGDYFIELPNV